MPVPRPSTQVAAADAGRRLDNFLLSRTRVPRPAVYRWIRTGQVRVNGGRARAHRRLRAGDLVRVPPHAETRARDCAAALPEIALPVLFEDAHLLVVSKPAGLPVHAGSRVAFGLIDVLRAQRAEEFWELAHRLDRGTSGCLMLARSPDALRSLQRQLRARRVEKTYWCLAAGRWRGGDREVRLPLQVRARHARHRKTVVDAQGRAARTRFSLLEQLPGACLLEARIDTGRTHQVRVHAESLGHPLVGDDRYGARAVNRTMRARGFARLFLHARRLRLRHPAGGRALAVEAPLPADCEEFLARLRAGAAARL